MLSTLINYEIKDLLKSRWIIAYTIFFFVLIESLYYFSGDSSKVFVSLTNILLTAVPLVSLLYGIQYVYNRREFLEVILSQPLPRKILFTGSYISAFICLSSAFIVGAGLPMIMRINSSDAALIFIIIVVGVLITASFLALAYLIAYKFNDKAKGFGAGLIVWFLLIILYDGMFMLALYAIRDYPLEIPALLMNIFNPIDLARVIITLELDISAMMGYTGAIYKKFFGSYLGISISAAVLLLWTIIPYILGKRIFIKKDF